MQDTNAVSPVEQKKLPYVEEGKGYGIIEDCGGIGGLGEIKKAFEKKGGWQIVYDNGFEQAEALKKLFLAFVESLLALALATRLIYQSNKKCALALAFIALNVLASLALLSLFKIPLDGASLCGLCVSLGLICDAALYVMDEIECSVSSMAVSTLTTIAAILPLCAVNKIVPGSRSLALACALPVGLSFILAATLLPPFVPEEKARNSLSLYNFSYKLPRKIISLSKILYILPLFFFVLLPKNLKSPDSEPLIFAQVEFNPEKRFDLIDEEMKPLLDKVKKSGKVKFVQSESRRGRGELQIVLKDAKAKNEVSKLLLREGKNLTGSLYVPLSPPRKKIVQTMRVALLGDDEGLCKKIIREAAQALQGENFSKAKNFQCVLNFKEDEKVFLARPDKDFLAKISLSVRDFSHFLRWSLFCPVAAKVFWQGQRKDVRIGLDSLSVENGASLEGIKNIKIKSIPAAALCSIKESSIPSRIFRKDFRRAAYFTLEFETKNSLWAYETTKAALKKINLPTGYYFAFPKEYENLRKNYRAIFFAFTLSLAAILFLICAQTENLLDSIKVTLTVPVSLFLPLTARALAFQPLSLGDALGMIFLSGICVNNALYVLAEYNLRKRKSGIAAAKKLFKSVLASSLTSAAGAVPVMIAGSGTFSGDLAFFMFLGSGGAIFAGLILFPNLLDKKNAPPIRRRSAFKNASGGGLNLVRLVLGNNQVEEDSHNCGKGNAAKGELEASNHKLQDSAADSDYHDD